MFDDYKIIIYIVLAILYFLFSGKKKSASKNTPPINQNPEPRTTPPLAEPKPVYKPKPLLQNPVPEPQKQPVPEPQPFSLEDILKEFDQTLEEKSAEKTRQREEVKAKVQEQPVRKIVDYDEDIKEEIQSLEIPSLLKAKENVSEDEHFTPYSLEEGKKSKYAAMFKDPESIRAAFVASEIFNRKY